MLQFLNLVDTNDTVFALSVGAIGFFFIFICYVLDKFGGEK